jgi:hypothetical protein
MKEELISFKTAKLAKEKGFDETCSLYWQSEGVLCDKLLRGNWNLKDLDKAFLAPTQSLLQKWLREKYNIEVESSRNSNEWVEFIKNKHNADYPLYSCTIIQDGDLVYGCKTHGNTYEEALEEGLQEGLKLI